MNPLIKKYALDRTGRNPNNLITNEHHTLVDNGRDGMRVFVLDAGSFYTDTLIVRDANGIRLMPNQHFVATYLYEEASRLSGLEVMGALVVTDPKVTADVYVDYQCVGGDYAQSTDALEQVLQTLVDDDRPVEWGDIVGKPAEYPPGAHLHALWELYGFEYLTVQLERIVQAVLVGDQAAFDDIRAYALGLHEEGKDYTDALDSRFQDHKNDLNNPHEVTKAQVGLGNVENFPLASHPEVQAGTATNRYVTVESMVFGIQYHAGDLLNEHISDKTNPHDVTKAQVGLSLVANYQPATLAEMEAGSRNDRYVTPLRVKEAIDYHAGSLLEQHVSDKSNPHEVTKTQVGLGNVENYPIASQSDMNSGTRNDRYATPLRVKQAIDEHAGTLLNQHVADKGNPHNVTKAQVGLGNVENYTMASDSEARAGSTRARYVNPANLGAVMNDHRDSGDHDSRYIRNNAGVDGSIRVSGGRAYVRIGSSWRQIWPAQWT